jgi:hypothetical protein
MKKIVSITCVVLMFNHSGPLIIARVSVLVRGAVETSIYTHACSS